MVSTDEVAPVKVSPPITRSGPVVVVVVVSAVVVVVVVVALIVVVVVGGPCSGWP